jgi:ATP-binding cassette subfamily B protein
MVVMVIVILTARWLAVPLSELAVLIYAFLKMIPAMAQLTRYKGSIDNFFPSYEQIIQLRSQARELKQQTGSKIFSGFNDKIMVKALSFAYPDHEPTLIDVTVPISRGKMIAFVGESGAGKSTLIDLIMGFNEPSAGQITIDGIPLQKFDIYSYRHRIGYVAQDSILFNMSIRDNMLWADDTASEADIKWAYQQANAHEFIDELPEGDHTVVGDRGVRLSGGQMQRIALARAILRKPDLLILDEATSSLDTHSERLIQQAIENIARETTVIVIAHRLSTIVNADYVYVLEKGRVVEEGPYAQLVQINGRFNQMVQSQVLETTN